MRFRAAALFDRGEPLRSGSQHGQAARGPTRRGEAANVAVQTHGGFGFAEEYDIERKFREKTRLYQGRTRFRRT